MLECVMKAYADLTFINKLKLKRKQTLF